MGDQRGGYDQGEDDRYIYGNEQQNPDDYGDSQFEEEQGGDNYAEGGAALPARDRIEQQRRSMRRNTAVLVSDDRNRQRTVYTIITVVCLLILAATFFFLLRNNSSNNTSPSGFVQPTPSGATPTQLAAIPPAGVTNSAGDGTTPTQVAAAPPAVATSAAGSGTTSTDTTPNVDATARPDQPTLPPGAATVPATAVPAGNPPPSPPNPGSDPSKVRTYTVGAGDTFVSIAAQFGVNTGQLMAANNATIKHPTQLQAGQSINIPAPSYSPPSVQWTVQPGEYLIGIIRALQATDTGLDKIAAANPCQLSGHGVCQPGYEIFPGDTLTIPFH
jgi:LysM repeat protein